MTNPIEQTTALGQSLWYDNIQRRLLENGELAAMIQRGDIRGVTSNPAIFHNAISKTTEYDSALQPLALSGWDTESIFWQLAIEDIQAACDLFRPLYEQTEATDGYVSLEVSPLLAHDTEGTISQAKRLWQAVARPNLMIKIPATPAGIPAIRQVIAAGINVNVTLIFAIERYRAVMDAYLSGLEDRLLAGGDIGNVHSVASFFVSRVDSKIDPRLPEDSPLRGVAAIANAKLAYEAFREEFASLRFRKLQFGKANFQRPLWASTSTKNPAYPDTIYIDNLIGPATVNTVPPATLQAFRDHGVARQTLTENIEEARARLVELEALGISMSQVTRELEEEGVRAFAEAFTALLASLEERRAGITGQVTPLLPSVEKAVSRLEAASAPDRLWSGDASLWTEDPAGQAEIRNRLGWLRLPETSLFLLNDLQQFVAEIDSAGIKKILLLGMGGSSLAPEVMAKVFGMTGGRQFSILDSTDPAQVKAAAQDFPPAESLYMVASKSGGTAEVNAMFDYFWHLSGGDGTRFVAITDPGTSLEKLAAERGFRRTFLADPTVGGRNSVLSPFGLVPAALMGIDVEKLLRAAGWMMNQSGPQAAAPRNPGLVLGALIGQAALEGRDKLTLLADPALASFGSWLEQLIAESTGKQGKGIVVVDGEPQADPASYGPDRLFIYLRRDGSLDELVTALREQGQPALAIEMPDPYDLGAEFYRWEIATAFACAVLGVNPFDQPDVQDNKNRTVAKIQQFRETGSLGEEAYVPGDEALPALKEFLALARPGDYVAINAYLRRNPQMESVLSELRIAVLAQTGCATTLGFGPRFLHSTGQLHKGGSEHGLFIQITAEPKTDIDIPGQGLSFGTLQRAQAIGDFEALYDRGRRILRIHLSAAGQLEKLVNELGLA